jgi:hypothetical protein
MAYAKDAKSAKVRRLSQPVIDGDGHWLEPMRIFLDESRLGWRISDSGF